MTTPAARGMQYTEGGPLQWTEVIAPKITRFAAATRGMRVLDVGFGTGFWAGFFADQGCTVVGIDPSEPGVAVARAARPDVRFEQMEVSCDMLAELAEDPFDLVVSTEVLEHLYDPQTWASGCHHALRPGGRLIGSTPYHGWLKNVAIAVAGKTDFHHDSLRVGGHIKFFSNRTLRVLLESAGFERVQTSGAGRLPLLWYSTVFAACRP
jgi:2-polyprenyl-3-methyl-5-hydroxy-6-metoxy-1,4-benzoquinol methylase